MKKRVLSLFMVLVLCLTLLPTAAFAEGEDVSISGGVIGGGETGGETGGEGGGIYVAPGSPTEGGGGTYIPGEDTQTEIWCVSKPDSIGRGYDGTTDGGTIPIDLTFTDGTNEIKLKEGTGFTAKKTFDSADAGWHTVTVEIALIGEAAVKYKLKAGEETFTIGGNINKAYPDLTVSLSKAACTVGEKILPLLSVEGAPEGAAVTYYYTQYKPIAGSSEYEGSEAMPKIDENTAISEPGTYYVYAKTAETKNYEEERSTTVELTVNEAVVEAASITKADGTDGGTYKTLPAALDAAQDGDTVKLLADHVTDADALNALGEDFTFEQYASIVPVVTKTLTLDLNHKTVDYLEVGFSETNEETQKKETLATGNLTVTGEGAYGRISNLMFMAGALDIRSGEIGGSEGAGLVCDVNSGTATISNGTVYGLTVLEGASVTVNGGSKHAGEWVVDSGATLNITDGTFGEVQFTRNGTIAISGGTFQSIKSYIAEELQPLMSLLDTQKVHAFYKGDDVQNGNATELADVTVKEHTHTMVNNKCACGFSCTHTNTEGASTIGEDGKCTVCGTQFAAGIGETYYTDVPSALDAATDGQTVKLLANTMLPSDTYVSKTLTLDLDGHSLSGYSLNVGGLTAMSQVRTGKLTVIDSSGGNGAVGVTVRDGGTLVFDPKNDHTTLLQLEVWGGTVELYGGKISRSGLRLNNNITLGDLLPQKAGLAYYRGDTQLTLEAAASQTCDLVVKSCSHGGKNGFDKSATTCPYCGAPAVAETALNNGEGNRLQRRFADLQTALDADRDGGATLKLLADVTGNYTINGTQDTGLDLNGHSIKGTVTVKTAAGSNTTTLSNTKNTTTVSIDNVVAYKGAKLAGSGKPAVIGTLTLAEGATWKTILNDTALGYKMLNADGTHKWYAWDDVKGSQLNNVIINRLPITTKILNLKVDGKNLTKVERGTTVQLCASCNAKDVTVTFSILKTGETTPITLTEPSYSGRKYTKDYSFDTIGEYTIYFTATKDGYTVQSAEKKLTVTKPNLSNAEITFPYGNEAAFNSVSATGVPMFVVTYNGTKLEENVDFVITRGASTYDVGPCTLTIKATDNGDYTGSKSAEWKVRPLKVAASVGDIIKTYDGTTDLPANAKITFKSADSYYTGITLRLAKGTDYEVLNARYDSADASETEKTVSFTIKLKNAGYVFEDDTTQKDFTLKGSETDKTFKINKATVPMNNPTGTLNIINGTCQTYTYDFNNILPGLPGGKYGTISYGQADISLVSQSGYYYDETIVEFKKGVLTLAQFYAKDGKMTGKIGTVKVNVTTTNYENFQLKLVLYAVDQIKPEPDGTITATEITYGDALSKSEISGKMKDPNTGDAVNGTFAWTDGTTKPDANDNYEAEWTFTPAAGYEKYATATGTVTIKVKPAKLIVSVKASSMYYTGEEQIASIIASGQSVDSTPVTFTYSDKVDGNYTSGGPTFTDAGTYTAYYKAEAANHEPATGTFTVTIDPLPISLLSVSSISKTYDGSADVTLTADKLTFFSKTAKATNIKLPDTAITFTNARFTKKQTDGSYLPSPEVGDGKALSFTMMLTSNNYVFEGKSKGTTEVSDVFATDDVNRFTITKATVPGSDLHPAVTVINDLAKTYEMVLSNDYLPKLSSPCEYGNVSYSLRGTYLTDGYKDTVQAEVVEENSQYKLKLTVPAVDYDKVSSVGTIDVRVTSDNYRDFYLTIGVKTKNKDVPVPDGPISASDITYGQALNDSKIAGKMKAGGKAIDGTFTWTNGTFKPAAGDYQAEWTFTPAEGYEEYATATGTVTIKVNKATPTFTAPTGLTAKYGQTLADVKLPDGWSWMDSSESVGGASTAAKTFQAKFTPKDTENYNTVENIELEVTVNKADGGNLKTVELEQKYTDASDHTYTPDWAGLPAGQDWTFSSEASIVLPKQDFAADGNLLTYAISGDKAGDKIALILKASCDNYKDFTITLNVTLTEKDDQKPLTITGNTSVIYGEKLTLTTTGGSGMGAVTYRIDTDASTGEATIDPETGVLTPVKVGSVSVIATKAGDNNYNDVTSAPFVLMIKPATPTGEPKYTKITTSGKTLKDVTLTIEGSTLNPSDGKLEWVDDKGEPLPDDTTVKANTTYKWRFTPDDDNYTTLTGEVELYHKSSSGGGWYDSYYTIKATAGAGGSISPSGNVSVREGGDQTFTITPDKGYAVANVKIDGKSIGAVKSYTFENVSSPHTIEAIFVKGTASASTGDSSNLPLWSALLLASTLALAGAVHLKRKRAR